MYHYKVKLNFPDIFSAYAPNTQFHNLKKNFLNLFNHIKFRPLN